MNKKPDELDKFIWEEARKELRDELKRLDKLPDGNERALKEAHALFRFMSCVGRDMVDEGRLDNAMALFGIARDDAVNDREVGKGNTAATEAETFSITLGAYADALIAYSKETDDGRGMSRKDACKAVSKMLTGDTKRGWRGIENWTKGQRDQIAAGREGAYNHQLAQAMRILRSAGAITSGKEALKKRLLKMDKRKSRVAGARKAFKDKR